MNLRYPFLLLCGWLSAMPSSAHEGHEHGETTAAPQLAIAIPRAEAQSELFELVTSLQRDQMTLFLDRFADNSPVDNARIEIESGNWKAVATPAADHTYIVKAAALAKVGSHPLVFTVTSGNENDLLETTLIVATPPDPVDGSAKYPWTKTALLLGAALFVAGGIAVALRRRKRGERK